LSSQKLDYVSKRYIKKSNISFQAIKAHDGVEVELHSFLTSAVKGGEW
jgi:hypothetical protein